MTYFLCHLTPFCDAAKWQIHRYAAELIVQTLEAKKYGYCTLSLQGENINYFIFAAHTHAPSRISALSADPWVWSSDTGLNKGFQRIAEKTLAQIAQTFLSPASQSTKSLTGFYGHFRSYLMRGSSCFQ
jgi:hypothetical protein